MLGSGSAQGHNNIILSYAQVPDGAIASAYVREAFRIAEEERPGDSKHLPSWHAPIACRKEADSPYPKAGAPLITNASGVPPPLCRSCPH